MWLPSPIEHIIFLCVKLLETEVEIHINLNSKETGCEDEFGYG
jgi:hypothetical protein